MGTSLVSGTPYTAESYLAAKTARDLWVGSQPSLPNISKTDGPLVACLGDMVADTHNEGTTIGAQHASVAQTILANKPDYFIALGDNCYDNGALDVFQTEYERTFGQLKNRTFFCIGNHEIAGCLDAYEPAPTVVSGGVSGSSSVTLTFIPPRLNVGDFISFNPSNPALLTGTNKVVQSITDNTVVLTSPLASDLAANATAYVVNDGRDYYTYADGRAGEPFVGYHAKNIGRYRWYFLDSTSASTAAAGSTQLRWLAADIAANPGKPIFASWHHPRWTDGSSGSVTDDNNYDPFVQTLQNSGRCQAIIVAHDHNYQRFDKIKSQGTSLDPLTAQPTGFMYFIVGSGGQNQKYSLRSSNVRRSFGQYTNYGALFVRLGATQWSYQFRQRTAANDPGTVIDEGNVPLFGV